MRCAPAEVIPQRDGLGLVQLGRRNWCGSIESWIIRVLLTREAELAGLMVRGGRTVPTGHSRNDGDAVRLDARYSAASTLEWVRWGHNKKSTVRRRAESFESV